MCWNSNPVSQREALFFGDRGGRQVDGFVSLQETLEVGSEFEGGCIYLPGSPWSIGVPGGTAKLYEDAEGTRMQIAFVTNSSARAIGCFCVPAHRLPRLETTEGYFQYFALENRFLQDNSEH